MFKKTLAGLIVASTLFLGCSSSTPVAQSPNSCVDGSCPVPRLERPRSQQVTGPTWSLTLPPGTEVQISPDNPREKGMMRQELVASWRSRVDDSALLIMVTSIDLKTIKTTPERFGIVTGAAILRGADVKILEAEIVDVSGQPATLVVFVISDRSLVAQLSVGNKDRGYILQCGGPVTERKRIADRCGDVLKSFKLVP